MIPLCAKSFLGIRNPECYCDRCVDNRKQDVELRVLRTGGRTMIQIVKTITEGRYNLVNTDFPYTENKHYIRSLSEEEVKDIIKTGNSALVATGEGENNED